MGAVHHGRPVGGEATCQSGRCGRQAVCPGLSRFKTSVPHVSLPATFARLLLTHRLRIPTSSLKMVGGPARDGMLGKLQPLAAPATLPPPRPGCGPGLASAARSLDMDLGLPGGSGLAIEALVELGQAQRGAAQRGDAAEDEQPGMSNVVRRKRTSPRRRGGCPWGLYGIAGGN